MQVEESMEVVAPLVTVVVPTRNSIGTVGLCLQSIVTQSYRAVEIVVVDNNSTDSTVENARRYTPHVFIAGPERSAQRNLGAAKAKGQYVVFIDSDMVLDPGVIAACVNKMRLNESIGGVIIPERSVGEGYWARCKALERSCYVGDDSIEAARFFRRALFLDIGGYDETLTAAEDWDISQRIAQHAMLVRVDAYISHLEGHLTLYQTMRSKFYYGQSLSRYIRKQPEKAVQQFTFIRPAFIRHWRLLARNPLLLLGMIVLKGSEFGAGGAGMVWATWRRRSAG